MRVAYKIFFVLAAVCVAWSCSPTKYVGKDEYLLDRVKLSVEGGGVNAVDVKRNIRQRPNTRILGTVRFHLGLYNLSGRDGEKRFNRWLRRIGEEPVIYDSTLVDRSAEQIRLYLKNAGFYNSVVRDTVVFRRKRATVSYAVETGPRTVIREVVFRQDTSGGRHRRAEVSGLLGNYYRDTTATLLDVDTPLDLGLLDDEPTDEAAPDDYRTRLQAEYRYLCRKFELQPAATPRWRLLRLRRQMSGIWQTCIVLQNTSFGSISVDGKKEARKIRKAIDSLCKLLYK